jgi:hypothetical protein
MNEKDWIILRLIHAACMARSPLANSEHYAKAALYLVQTYGLKQVGECTDQLKQENV